VVTRPRGANGDLERAWERTGWSRKELARRVNRRSHSRGPHLNTDASRVRAWFAGQHPQPPVPAILCELFSEHFGFPVRPEEIGLAADPDTDTGASLFTAASEQTYLLGWMAFDDGRQALAQRYLLQSLRLTQASGDATDSAAPTARPAPLRRACSCCGTSTTR
jgi:hypothetical protein